MRYLFESLYIDDTLFTRGLTNKPLAKKNILKLDIFMDVILLKFDIRQAEVNQSQIEGYEL